MFISFEDSPADAHPALDAGILDDVRNLGRFPKEISNAKTEAEIADRKLVERIRKAKSKLLPGTRKYLGILSTRSGDRLAKRHCVHPTLEGPPPLDAGILDDVRKLGRLPRELRNKHRGLTDEEKYERLLAERIRMNRDKLLPTTQVSLD